jgi:1-deoxy-D-xylulose-5-phosphate synthase
MAFEALNHLATTDANVLVIINDNDMSIDPNVGGLQNHLNNINPSQNIFTNLGLPYSGPFEGNDIIRVLTQLANQKNNNGPRVIHFKTQKGFGYGHSQKGNATHWHAPGKFAIETGQGFEGESEFPKTYQHIVGETLCKLATANNNIYVITPAMASGSKLKEFEQNFPERFFDVGIAEQHAVTFSAGIAAQGKLPFCVIYSTFLQRGYDQLIHDVALQNLKVVFLIDRAGLVGNDGGTHHGTFDLAFLNCIPNMTIFTPADEEELANILTDVPNSIDGPIAIRYPRGKGNKMKVVYGNDIYQAVKSIKVGKKKAVISIGGICNSVSQSLSKMDEEIAHFALQQVKPLPTIALKAILNQYQNIYIVEDGVKMGGIGVNITAWANELSLSNKIRILGLPDQFIEHGSTEELYDEIGLSSEKIRDWLIST